jgi:transcriptional antiterminator RfaH
VILIKNMQHKKWLAVYTRPRYEKKIEKALKDNQITCYLPLIKTLRIWSDRKKWVEIPLFSSYIFVQVDQKEHINVLKIPGVVRFVSFEGNAVEIPESQIDNIKWILSSEIIAEPIEKHIPVGSQIEIIKGPLTGLRAEMVNYNNKKTIIVRIAQMDKSFEIHIPGSHVRQI